MKFDIGDSLKVKRIQIVGENKNFWKNSLQEFLYRYGAFKSLEKTKIYGRTRYKKFSIGMAPSIIGENENFWKNSIQEFL
jgi:hypothetical protein